MSDKLKPMTTITVRHTPGDLLRLGLYAALRSPTLRWMLFALAVVILGINLYQQKTHLDPISLFAIAVTTAIFTSATFVLMLVIMPLATLLQNRRHPPAAETHSYSLAEAGLVRRSA